MYLTILLRTGLTCIGSKTQVALPVSGVDKMHKRVNVRSTNSTTCNGSRMDYRAHLEEKERYRNQNITSVLKKKKKKKNKADLFIHVLVGMNVYSER